MSQERIWGLKWGKVAIAAIIDITDQINYFEQNLGEGHGAVGGTRGSNPGTTRHPAHAGGAGQGAAGGPLRRPRRAGVSGALPLHPGPLRGGGVPARLAADLPPARPHRLPGGGGVDHRGSGQRQRHHRGRDPGGGVHPAALRRPDPVGRLRAAHLHPPRRAGGADPPDAEAGVPGAAGRGGGPRPAQPAHRLPVQRGGAGGGHGPGTAPAHGGPHAAGPAGDCGGPVRGYQPGQRAHGAAARLRPHRPGLADSRGHGRPGGPALLHVEGLPAGQHPGEVPGGGDQPGGLRRGGAPAPGADEPLHQRPGRHAGGGGSSPSA